MSKKLNLFFWLDERLQNCRRIARLKRGDDRQGWLEDASYFSRAKEAVRLLMEASGDEHANCPLRTYIALRLLRAFNNGTEGFDGTVVATVNKWFDDGRKGPVPWPDSPFFSEWAERVGFAKIGEYVGFKFDAKLVAEEGEYAERN
jgi:hypothetical protein